MKTKTAVLNGKPDAGNPHVRFDEGEVASAKPRRGSLLYKRVILAAAAAALSFVGFAGTADENGVVPSYWYTFNGAYASIGANNLSFGGEYVGNSWVATDATSGHQALQLQSGAASPWGGNLNRGSGDFTIVTVAKTADIESGVIWNQGGNNETYSFALVTDGATGVYLRFFGSSWAAEVKNKTDALRVTKDDAATAYHVYTVSYDSTSKTWSLGVDFEVPVTVVADLNGFASQKFQFGSIYGGRILDMSAGNGVCLYEYRLYQKLLTKSQLNKILATYAAEFSSVVQTDLLSVRGEPAELGEVSPYYGSHRGYSVGQTELFTAPANWTSIDGRTRTTCLGYKVYTNEVVYVEGEGNSFTYVHPDCLAGAELVWQWSRKYKVTATAGEGGTVSPEEQWVAEGGSATVTAMAADEDGVFAGWTGDQIDADNPLTLANVRSPLSVTATFASAICVATNGSDEAAGTAAAPFATIAHALEVAGAQARATSSTVSVKVGPGTFPQDKELVISEAIRLIGAGRDLTILDGQKKDRVLSITHADAEVSDLTITNGSVPWTGGRSGGGVAMSAGALRRCCVSGNSSGNSGGGICATGGLVSRCLVINNTAAGGGGMFMQFMQVSNCIVSNNTASGSGGGVSTWGGTLENSLICGNTAASGGGVGVYHGVTMRFCTIVNNTATGEGGGVLCASADWGDKGHDNIIWGNAAPVSPDINTKGIAYLANWKNICSSVKVGENLSENELVADPLFRNAAKGNYRLRLESPCRNAAWGTPTTAVDADGNPRVRFRYLDIGCYECQVGPGLMLLLVK